MKIKAFQLRKIIKEEKRRIIKEWFPESEGSTPDGMTDRECKYIDTEIDATTRQVIAVIFDDYDEEEEIARSEPVEYKSSLSPKMARLAYNKACNDAKLKLNESVSRRKEYGKMKITKQQLRRIIKEEKARLIRESMEELPPPGAGRKAVVDTDTHDMANVYIQGAVFDGLEEMGMTAEQADAIIAGLRNRPDIIVKALKAGAEDYKRKLGMTSRPKPRSV